MCYESYKHKLSILQDNLNQNPELKDKIVPYIWTLRNKRTDKVLTEYVVTGRNELEAKLTGNPYFSVDNLVPTYERAKYTEEELDNLVTVTLMK